MPHPIPARAARHALRRRAAAAGLLMLAWGAGGAGAQDAAAPAPAGDPALGEKVFAKCRSCHQIGPGAHNAVGPELNGVIGRHSGAVAGYSYSEANKASGLTWDPATFRRYIVDPKGVVPGTKMSFAGLERAKDVENLLAYLQSFDAEGARK